MESGKYKSGTTLIEILIVVAVIMLLAGMVLGIAAGIDNQSKEKAVKATFELLESALQEYYDFRGVFPVAADANPNVNCEILYAELNSLPGSREVLEQISDKIIQNKSGPTGVPEIYDPWGTVLDYRYDAAVDSFPRLISAGPDRNHGIGDPAAAADNITNK
ncbi:MAG: type II secretion system protein [Planctomycetes bacterium]|nr:type II secretion system protein [Planctomycetota bacterium]